jgi:DNA mismatch repair protein MSH4
MSCTTDEITSLGERCRKSLNDIIIHSYRIVKASLETHIRSNIGVFFRICESIALLDMLCSFATVVASSTLGMAAPVVQGKSQAVFTFTRPDITHNGPIVIKNGRHPIRQMLLGSDYVPVDVYVAPEKFALF